VQVYRQQQEPDKFLDAQDFIMRHTDGKVGRQRAARDVVSFLYQRGKTDAGIKRYEDALKYNPKDAAALSVLDGIYFRAKPDRERAAEISRRLDEVNTQLAVELASRLEKDAEAAPQTAATLLKNAAEAWLEAGDKSKALAAAKKSLAQPPEQRGDLLTYYWRDGLGDVFLATGEPGLAVQQFEAAVAAAGNANLPSQKQAAQKKLESAKAGAEKKP
jgi:tetratricopeptide (TPR) repeat protein